MIAAVEGRATQTTRRAAWNSASILRTSPEGRPYINLNG
jgi:hypothetical protein